MARHRFPRNASPLPHYLSMDMDDPPVDFGAAGLYLVGLQTVLCTVVCSAVSVLSCWILPSMQISAVRTLAITTAVALAMMKSPIRLGRVRGVLTMFNALRPCVILYISVLVVEQLVHTCASSDATTAAGSWRRYVFQTMVVFMILSGFVRARSPHSETDVPFLITLLAVLVIALLPPPAVVQAGPLCEPASVGGASERLVRSLLFSSLYVVHVYCSAPNRNAVNEIALSVARCAASSVWVLGSHWMLMPLALVQAILALTMRFGNADAEELPLNRYAGVDSRSENSDIEPMTLPTDQKYMEDDRVSPHLDETTDDTGNAAHAGHTLHPSSAFGNAPPLRGDLGAPPRHTRQAPQSLSFQIGSSSHLRSTTCSAEQLAAVAASLV